MPERLPLHFSSRAKGLEPSRRQDGRDPARVGGDDAESELTRRAVLDRRAEVVEAHRQPQAGGDLEVGDVQLLAAEDALRRSSRRSAEAFRAASRCRAARWRRWPRPSASVHGDERARRLHGAARCGRPIFAPSSVAAQRLPCRFRTDHRKISRIRCWRSSSPKSSTSSTAALWSGSAG